MSAPLCSSVRFGDHLITYDDRVLAPRPWTLHQAEWAAELARVLAPGPMLELCAGAGQIGLAAAASSGRPLVQVDLDPVACDFARINADHAGLGDRVEVRCGDLARAVRPDERFPLVIADPPYLPRHAIGRFPDDPLLAVDGGVDGLAVTRACVAVIDAVLAEDGLAILQVHGAQQAEALASQLPGSLALGEIRAHDSERAIALLARPDSNPTGGGR